MKRKVNNSNSKPKNKKTEQKKSVNAILKYFEAKNVKNETTSNSISSQKTVDLMLTDTSTISTITAEQSVRNEVVRDRKFGGSFESSSTSSSRRAPSRTSTILDNHATSGQKSRAQLIGVESTNTRGSGYDALEQWD